MSNPDPIFNPKPPPTAGSRPRLGEQGGLQAGGATNGADGSLGPLVTSYAASAGLSVVPNRQRPAWLLSLIFHTIIFLLLLIGIQAIPRGAAEIENRPGGIVLVDMQSTKTEYLSEGEVLDPSEAVNAENSSPQVTTNELPPELPGMAASQIPIDGVGDQLLDGLPGADSLIVGPAPSRQIGGKVTTEVFGVKGTGSKFVYVFDRSRSMEGYERRPLMAARRALLESVESLTDQHQFQIIFYNQGVTEFKPDRFGQLHFADDKTKQAARTFIESIRGDGGTDHLNALKKALLLRPDVIFFLTDAEGGFTPTDLRELSQLNRSAAVINAIEFGEQRGSDASLERLARENAGQYLFKDIRSFRDQP